MTGGFQPLAFQPNFQQVGGSADAGRRRPRVSIYRVKVDGQRFEFKSLAEAIAFLDKAKAFALQHAREVARKATETTGKPIKVKAPEISYNTRELRPAVTAAEREIERIYRQAVIDAEIGMLFAMQKQAEDDEDSILLLM